MTESRQDSGEFYESYRPLMLRALGRLARQGFVVPPQDASDLIQSFFLSEWPSVQRTHDPDRTLDPYLFRAFLNFARTWVIRESRYRRVLEEVSSSPRHRDPAGFGATDLLDVNEALSRLSAGDRDYLLSYVEDRSQRSIAQARGISRHEARQRLVEALGRFVIGLGHFPDTTEAGREVARLTWGDQRSVEDCALLLNKDVSEIESLHAHNVRVVGSILSRLRRSQRP